MNFVLSLTTNRIPTVILIHRCFLVVSTAADLEKGKAVAYLIDQCHTTGHRVLSSDVTSAA